MATFKWEVYASKPSNVALLSEVFVFALSEAVVAVKDGTTSC